MIETLGDAATNILTPTKKYSIVIPGTDQLIPLDKEERKKFDLESNKFTTDMNNTVKNFNMNDAVKYITQNDSIPGFIKREILNYDNAEKVNKLQQLRKNLNDNLRDIFTFNYANEKKSLIL